MQTVKRRGNFIALFVALGLCAYAISTIALQGMPESGYVFLASVAVPFDLLVVVPALFYLLVIKKYKLSLLFLLPVIALGSFFVFQVAKPDNLVVVLTIAAFVVAAEIVVAVRGFMRLQRAFCDARRASGDPSVWFFTLAKALVHFPRAAKLLGSELATAYYALFSWKKQPLVSQGATAFTYHKSGYVTVIGTIICLMPVEIVIVHLLVSQWSLAAATVLTILSVYGMLWLLGDCRASILRPITVSCDAISINSGLRFSTTAPLALIESVNTNEFSLPKSKTVNLGIMGSPNVWLIFSDDIETETFTGAIKKTRAIGLSVDEASQFRAAISEQIARYKEQSSLK